MIDVREAATAFIAVRATETTITHRAGGPARPAHYTPEGLTRCCTRDAVGHDIVLLKVANADDAAQLVGQSVTALGEGDLGARGQITAVTGATVTVTGVMAWIPPVVAIGDATSPPCWGAERASEFADLLSATTTVPVTDDVVAAYVDLSVAWRSAGHALHQKVHVADPWVAATAIALDRPLLSLDGVFAAAPGLRLLSAGPELSGTLSP